MKRSILLYWASFLIGTYIGYVFLIDTQDYLRYSFILLTISAVLKIYSINFRIIVFAIGLMVFGAYLYTSDYNINTEDIGKVDNIRGVIVEEKYRDGDYERYIIRLLGDQYNYKNYRLALTLYESTNLEIGNEIIINGYAEEFRSNRNPNLYSPKNKYKSEYIHNNIISKSRDIDIVKQNSLSYMEGLSYEFKEEVIAIIDRNIGLENSALLKSMILGDSSYMERDELSLFRDIGLGHMISVSGLHIGMIYGAIYMVLNRLLGIHRRLGQILGIIVVWIYICLIGFPISSVRAAIILLSLIVSKFIYKPYDSLDMIGFTGLIMIIYKPLWAMNIGYQLSFMGALFLAIANEKKVSPLIAIFIGLLPLNMVYFNRIPLISLLSNLLLVPILSLVLLLGIAMVIASQFLRGVEYFLGSVIEVLFIISDIISKFLSSSLMYIDVRSPSIEEIVFFYILIMVVMGVINIVDFDIGLIQIFIVYSFIVSFCLLSTGEHNSRVEFLDVGQGDCSIITIGDKNYMIDSGGSEFSNYDVGENTVYPYLKKRGIKKLDGFIISHYHADHLKGFMYLAENIEVESIIIGYKNPKNELYKELIEIAKRENIGIIYVGEKKSIRVDSNNEICFLPRKKEKIDLEEDNDNSLTVLLKSYGKKILFTGDMESKGERDFIERYSIGEIDVLKVPHHGSNTSSTDIFLDKLNPKVSIIQVGENNYGHPSLEVLDRFSYIKSKVYRNDISGMIELSLGEDHIVLNEFLREKRRPYHTIKDNMGKIYILIGQVFLWLILINEYGKYRDIEENKSEHELQRAFKYDR